jgi:hypothetical protein
MGRHRTLSLARPRVRSPNHLLRDAVWQSGSSGIHDTSWTTVSCDITTYMNANLRVRFGQNVDSGGVIAHGGWNIDDVKISWGNGCPGSAQGRRSPALSSDSERTWNATPSP